ncbi:hypothetical protein BC941DRAFT_142518 [Chlamydoabsidia padenii]|nr:hypothetical protein BC941DRAFT_142518 [Chlamydoabsidia padenii]
MNSSSSFGYDDVLEDNPFSDVISPNAVGQSTSTHLPSAPAPPPPLPAKDTIYEPTNISPIDTAINTITTTSITDTFNTIITTERHTDDKEDDMDKNDTKNTIQDVNSSDDDTEKMATDITPPSIQQPPQPSVIQPASQSTSDHDQLANTTESLTLEEEGDDLDRTRSLQPYKEEEESDEQVKIINNTM